MLLETDNWITLHGPQRNREKIKMRLGGIQIAPSVVSGGCRLGAVVSALGWRERQAHEFGYVVAGFR